MNTVLCIDDDPMILEFLSEALELSGYDVHTAEGGTIGLEMIKSHPVDLIITDLRMPEPDGFAILRHVIRTHPELPIIVVSGTLEVGDAVQAMKLGAWDYIIKPIESFARVEQSLKIALEKAALVQENRTYRENLEEKVEARTSALRTEIRERKKLEKALRSSLEEKEILLKEIHHRVKNNLQIISSLLSLQAAYITDDTYREMFLQSQNRIRSMAIVHEELYGSDDLSRIHFRSYVDTLLGHFAHLYENREVVEFIVDVEDVLLPLATAIPCGLILNELVTNSLRHAFLPGEGGTIAVRLHADPSSSARPRGKTHYTLEVSDTGRGLPENFSSDHHKLGMELVMNLVDQLDGKLSCDSHGGARFIVTFSAAAVGKKHLLAG